MRTRWEILAPVVAILAACAPQAATAEAAIEGPALVLDGDTIVIAGIRIRLFGIDAPEMRAWPWGPRARAFLDRLVDGKKVRCLPKTIDRYKRPVAICTVGGRDISASLVRAGLATSYRIYSRRYDAAERAARAAGAGVWATGK